MKKSLALAFWVGFFAAACAVAPPGNDSDAGGAGAGDSGRGTDGDDGGSADTGPRSDAPAAGDDAAEGGTGGGAPTLVDCSASGDAGGAAVCQPPGPNNTRGSGLRVAGSGLITNIVNGGFYEQSNHRVVAAAQTSANGQSVGAVFAFDVFTGDRTLVSGTGWDASKSAATTVGNGAVPINFTDVQRGPDGAYYALTGMNETPVQIIKVDPSTGDRTVVFDSSNATCSDGGAGLQSPMSYAEWLRFYTLAISPSGTFYLEVEGGGGAGIAAISGSTCSIVSWVDASGATIGGGQPWSMTALQGVVYDAGSLWAVDGLNQWLFKIDPASGARTVVSGSSRAPKVGTGSAPIEAHWISLAGSTVYTSGGFADANVDLTAVDVATGDRTAPPAWVGPATTANLGGWDETPNWPIPGSTILVVGIDEALVLVDVTTGNSNLLSY